MCRKRESQTIQHLSVHLWLKMIRVSLRGPMLNKSSVTGLFYLKVKEMWCYGTFYEILLSFTLPCVIPNL